LEADFKLLKIQFKWQFFCHDPQDPAMVYKTKGQGALVQLLQVMTLLARWALSRK